jgi:NAD(P)-dependent dehydrogenase (short-subunit alcohol dehydrogenase family)
MTTSKYAVITGASRGLGRHLAHRYWEAGFSLGLVGRNRDAIRQAVSDFAPAASRVCDVFDADMGDQDSMRSLIADISTRRPQINVVVNNAAIQGPIGPLEQNDPQEWERAVRVNLLGPVAICRGLIPRLVSAPDASIINLSGGGATGPRGNFSAYASTKAALVRFSETLAEEVKGQGITVNCIAPGAMKTAMLGEVLEIGAGRAGEREFANAAKVFEDGGASVDRVADLALFLSSAAARGITGKLISAVWDRWEAWPAHLAELAGSDIYTLRRIAGRDRGCGWGDR